MCQKGYSLDGDNIKECSLKCTGGQTYQECADPCQHSCLTIASNVKCLKKCVEGCACPPGTTLNNDEMCIPVSECQCIFEGKEYLPNSKRLDGSDVCICENAVWNCRAASLKELVSVTNPDDLMQRDPEYCGKQLNMEYTNCVPVCPPTCQNKLVEQECATYL
ncbi:von Willebrand factor-like [Tachypleus tridentatus]|uniref:von Willebrand factor-like n=1 Tax=Tachypleus tridentatus TaxID=6853 RepID=UPI003FD4D0D6